MNGSILEWVERLGGWAVVVVIGRWMMLRMDRMFDNLTRSVDAFAGFPN